MIGHVTIQLPIPTFLFVLHCDQAPIQPFSRYWVPNIIGSRLWPFRVTWRHRSCEQSIPHMPFAIGCPMSIDTEALSLNVFEIFDPKVPCAHTHSQTHTCRKWFHILSHALYCIGQTINDLTRCGCAFRPGRPSASNLEQAANLLCVQANSASYPQRVGKMSIVAHGLRGEGLARWLGRWYVCVLHRGSNCSPSRALDGRIMRSSAISCHFRDCKALLFASNSFKQRYSK